MIRTLFQCAAGVFGSVRSGVAVAVGAAVVAGTALTGAVPAFVPALVPAAGGAPVRVVLQDRVPFDAQVAELEKQFAADAKNPALDKRVRDAAAASAKTARGDLADLAKSGADAKNLSARQRVEFWEPRETAFLICDMWASHGCRHATRRIEELAPVMNRVIAAAREKGVLIIHAPSGDLSNFENLYPELKNNTDPAMRAARENSKAFRKGFGNNTHWPAWEHGSAGEKGHPFPVSAGDGGCDTCGKDPAWPSNKVSWRQTPALEIKAADILTDDYKEIIDYCKSRGVKNIVLLGVHTNMCVMGRPFGLRALKKQGFNTALMRDMTDLMYNNHYNAAPPKGKGQPPHVSHWAGLDLTLAYIEAWLAPTVLSTDFTGTAPFRFKEDPRPRLAFITAEGEYRTSQRFQQWGDALTRREIAVEFATGIPLRNANLPGRHNIENLRALDTADLAVLTVRRRALPPAQMAKIKNYLAAGKPLLAIRTASHAFGVKPVPKGLAAWQEFDRDVLGGNYTGHYGHYKEGTQISVAAGKQEHPLLRGVAAEFNSPAWLYKNTPLASKRAEVLLTGKDPGPKNKREPVLWTNGPAVIYTSLGHWDDWSNPNFTALVNNAVDILLKR